MLVVSDIANAPEVGVCSMVVSAVDQCLKVLDFDHSALLIVLDVGINLFQLVAMLREELLDSNIAVQGLLVHAKDLESLLLGYEASFDSKAFLSNLLTSFVVVPLSCGELLLPVMEELLPPDVFVLALVETLVLLADHLSL